MGAHSVLSLHHSLIFTMIRRRYLSILTSLSLGSVFAAYPSAQAAEERSVVMISVDGLAHYYFDDPKAEMPNIRKLAAEGARAEKMKAVLPTVTWPNHTSLVTGVTPAKHGVTGNSYFDRKELKVVPLIWDPLLDKEQIIKVPTIYDLAKKAGMSTAAVTWPGSRGIKNFDWTVPCVNKSDLFVEFSTPSLLEEFKAAGIPYENEADGFKDGQGENRDRIHVRMLNHIISKHKPRFTLFHILEVDHIEHAHGPQSPEAYAAVRFADDLVGEVWAQMKQTFGDKATIIIVSDHGFFNYRQTISPNVALRDAGLLTALGGKVTGGEVRSSGQGGSTMIYILDELNREKLIPQIAAMMQKLEGVSLVLTPDKFPAYGLPTRKQNPNFADIVLSAKEGYMFNDSAGGDVVISPITEKIKGAHGYDPNEPRLHATFVASGSGIKRGAKLGTVTNISVAPTAAALLGLKMPNVEGQVIEAALER